MIWQYKTSILAAHNLPTLIQKKVTIKIFADVLYIYPNKVKKQSFENNREAILQIKEQQNKNNNQSSTNDIDPLASMLLNPNLNNQEAKENKDTFNHNSSSNANTQALLMNNAKQKSQSIFEMNINRFQQFHDESIKKYNQWVKKRQDQNVDTLKRDIESKKKNEMNLDLDYWKTKFLYPYALDTGPLKLQENGVGQVTADDLAQQQKIMEKLGKAKNFNILETNALQFPLSQLQNKEEFLSELQTPIAVSIEQIIMDMFKYTKDFPIKIIPHVTEGDEINDIIHNYKKNKSTAKMQQNIGMQQNHLINGTGGMTQKQSAFSLLKNPVTKKNNLALEQNKPNLEFDDIMKALKEIQSQKNARLIGLVSHLVYWSVFGHINQLPLDAYHKKLLFISIAQIQSELESKYTGKRVFPTFIMPMILLAVRIEIELIFKNSYPEFFTKSTHERKAKSSTLPKIRNKFYTRSALVQQLIPNPSEGKVRAIFGGAANPDKTNYGQIQSAQPGLRRKFTATQNEFAQNIGSSQRQSHGGAQTAFTNNRRSQLPHPRHNSYMTQKPSMANMMTTQNGGDNEIDPGLDLLNRVQMFQIAVNKINHNLELRKKEPIFKLASNAGQASASNTMGQNRNESLSKK
eukprot:403375759